MQIWRPSQGLANYRCGPATYFYESSCIGTSIPIGLHCMYLLCTEMTELSSYRPHGV